MNTIRQQFTKISIWKAKLKKIKMFSKWISRLFRRLILPLGRIATSLRARI